MGMLLKCENSKCGSQDYHELDEASGDVLCLKCNRSVDVTMYIKRALKAQGQIVRKAKSALEAKCASCGSSDGPVLLKYSKTLYKVGCKNCHEINVHLTKYFLSALKMKADIEVVDVSNNPVPKENNDAIVKTADGAIIVNKPITANTQPAERKRLVTPTLPPKKAAPKKAAPAKVVFTDLDTDSEDISDRPKITTSKKTKAEADARVAALRSKMIDPTTGDVTEEMKQTIIINNE